MEFKPLLSPREEPLSYPNFFKEVPYPAIYSPKYDGIRGCPKKGVVLSRTLKPLPSVQVQDEFGWLEHADGELIEGSPYGDTVYNRTQSHVMSEDKPGELSYYIFDYTHPDYFKAPFYERLAKLKDIWPSWIEEARQRKVNIQLAPQVELENEKELLCYEESMLDLGFEGLMGKSPVGPYIRGNSKENRATWKEHIVWKLKRFKDAEGLIMGMREGSLNQNEKQYDERGLAFRQDLKDGKVPSGMVGTYEVLYDGQIIDVAPGNITHDQRREHLKNKDKYIEKEFLKFRYMAHGVKDKPRHPRAQGLRSQLDM